MKKNQILSLIVAGALLFGVTSATSDYIHEQNGTISICDPDSNGTKCITMQDKNFGASEAGTGTSSYGNHYQRGNNHGFAIGCYENGCSDTVTNNAVTDKAVWNNSYNNYGYNGGITNFMKGSNDYRENNSHYDGLWGGANDSQANNRGYDEENNVAINVENRQGPCGEGYHVPSIGEWNKVLEYRAENNLDNFTYELSAKQYGSDGLKRVDNCAEGSEYWCYDENDNSVDCDSDNVSYIECDQYDDTFLLKFQEDFKIPFAGNRYSNDAKVNDVGNNAYLWSSSPSVGNDYARGFYLFPNEAYADNLNGRRANGFSVRCFKNSYLSFPSSEGGGNTGQVTLTLTAGENTCTLQDYNLGTHNVSSEDQNVSTSGQDMVCEFLKNPGATIQLSMGDLADGTKTIGRQYFTGIVSSLGNPLGTIANLTGGSYNFLSSHIIYTKEANTIGTWTGSLAIEGIIPAGTPSGEYTGELNIIICEGC